MRIIFCLLLILGMTPLLWSATGGWGWSDDEDRPHGAIPPQARINAILTAIAKAGADLDYQPEHIQQAVQCYVLHGHFPQGFNQSDLPAYIAGVLQANLEEEEDDDAHQDAAAALWFQEQSIEALPIVGSQVAPIFSAWFQGLPPLTEATIETYLQAIHNQGTTWLVQQIQLEATLIQDVDMPLPDDVQATAPHISPQAGAATEVDAWFNRAILPRQGAPECISETMAQLLPPDLSLAYVQTIQKVLESILNHLLTQYAGQNMLLAIQEAALEEEHPGESDDDETNFG